MTTLKHKHSHHNNYDLYGDIAKIKNALNDATQDVKNKAGEIFSESIDDIKMKSNLVKDNVATYTAEKPFKTLSITLLAGIVIGYFLRK